jgi:hypothetical protein
MNSADPQVTVPLQIASFKSKQFLSGVVEN